MLGPNGSGKSTTINCILSLLKFQKGSIKIFDKVMRPNSYDIKEKIGVIFQEVAVFEELTVYENIDYFCGLYISDKNINSVLVLKDGIMSKSIFGFNVLSEELLESEKKIEEYYQSQGLKVFVKKVN